MTAPLELPKQASRPADQPASLPRVHWTPHPLIDREPEFRALDEDEFAALVETCGAEAALAYHRRREERIRLSTADPYKHEFALPHWPELEAEILNHLVTFVPGGNNPGKSRWAASFVMRVLTRKITWPNLFPGKLKVLMLAQDDDASKAFQQDKIYQQLPAKWRGLNESARKPAGYGKHINYSEKNGFTERTLVLPKPLQGQLWFKTVAQYIREPQSFQGTEFDLVVVDEGAPAPLFKTLTERASKRGGKVVYILTCVNGYDQTLGQALEGATVVKTLPMQWLWHGVASGLRPEDRATGSTLHGRIHPAIRYPELRLGEHQTDLLKRLGCPAGHMPYLMQPLNPQWRVVFMWNTWNPFQPPAQWKPGNSTPRRQDAKAQDDIPQERRRPAPDGQGVAECEELARSTGDECHDAHPAIFPAPSCDGAGAVGARITAETRADLSGQKPTTDFTDATGRNSHPVLSAESAVKSPYWIPPQLPAQMDSCVGDPRWKVLVKMFGWIERLGQLALGNFNPETHIVRGERQAALDQMVREGKATVYQADDPETQRSHFLLWLAVFPPSPSYPQGLKYLFDESPRMREGEWVNATGERGEGQFIYRAMGSNWYKRYIREREREWNICDELVVASGLRPESDRATGSTLQPLHPCVIQRRGDPRGFATEESTATGTRSLFELYLEDHSSEDPAYAPMIFLPAKIRRASTLDLDIMINLLKYDEDRAARDGGCTAENCPQLLVSARCENFIRCALGYTLTDTGKKDEESPLADPIDSARYLFSGDTPYIEPVKPGAAQTGGAW